jgi:hypothetical protein
MGCQVRRLRLPRGHCRGFRDLRLWGDGRQRANLVLARPVGIKASEPWYLVSNLHLSLDLVWSYGQRFCCEQLFREQKSGIFQLESRILHGSGLTKSPVEAGDQGACPSADPSSFVPSQDGPRSSAPFAGPQLDLEAALPHGSIGCCWWLPSRCWSAVCRAMPSASPASGAVWTPTGSAARALPASACTGCSRALSPAAAPCWPGCRSRCSPWKLAFPAAVCSDAGSSPDSHASSCCQATSKTEPPQPRDTKLLAIA